MKNSYKVISAASSILALVILGVFALNVTSYEASAETGNVTDVKIYKHTQEWDFDTTPQSTPYVKSNHYHSEVAIDPTAIPATHTVVPQVQYSYDQETWITETVTPVAGLSPLSPSDGVTVFTFDGLPGIYQRVVFDGTDSLTATVPVVTLFSNTGK